ncbi:adhesin [Oceanobacillus piezotolerans]|uniref:Adhesin n=1 Tax=Oceanobacillus piezotolerans TaxID=2448030 RepID=A0A498DF44_9BACI|nr:zinc ABC transporter substrate-binding protein [Oceanobacillus piezotolerans]RLL46541.1 adhesin [Oceanobacillus piezotolerans]
MRKAIKSIILLLFISIFMIGCAPKNATTKEDDSLTIYTSIYPIQYAIERIAGDTLSVKTVYPPGVDAHSYEPTSKDMTAIAESDAFFYIGSDLEAFAETAADALQNQDVSLIEIGKHEELFQTDSEDNGHNHTDEEHGHDQHDGHNHGDKDPHIWIDPLRMIKMSEIIKEELVKLNPEAKEQYNQNFVALEKDLLTLDEQFKRALENKENKQILVSHAAYGYWEDRYGIEQIAINGISSSSEPSQKELTEIIDQAKAYGLEYIIFEQNTANRVSQIIQNEIGVDSLTIHNLAVLTEQDITNGEDYISLMQSNIEILEQATE